MTSNPKPAAASAPRPAWLETLTRFGWHADGMIAGLSDWVDTEGWVKYADLVAACPPEPPEIIGFGDAAFKNGNLDVFAKPPSWWETVAIEVDRLRAAGLLHAAASSIGRTLALQAGEPGSTPGAATSPPPAEARDWQDIETAPKDREVFFWLVPKRPDESYTNTSGHPIVANVAPYFHRGKWQSWGSLMKPTHWRELLDPPGRAPGRPEGPTT